VKDPIVYGLYLKTEPQELRYIGKTINGAHWRWVRHVGSARRGQRQPVYDWMRQHGPDAIGIRVLCRAAVADLSAAEVWTIAEARESGHRLLNCTDGGDGASVGRRLTEEHRRAISAGRRGIKFSPEHRANLATALRKRYETTDLRDRISASNKRRFQAGTLWNAERLILLPTSATVCSDAEYGLGKT
jgi:hypothetical protein